MSSGGKFCRLCSGDLSSQQPYRLSNAPRGAQWLPSQQDFDQDQPVTLEIYQCPFCSLVQLAGEPVIYKEGMTSVTGLSPTMLAHRRQQAKEFIARYGLKGRRVVEIGCGDGHFLKLLEEEGVQAVGIEPSVKAAQMGRLKGARILEGYVQDGRPLPGAPYDAFVNFHVLEHVPDPGVFLRAVAASLKEGAAGLVEVPSLEQALEGRRFYDFLSDHLSYFTRETLTAVLQAGGFAVEEVVRNWSGEHLVAYVRAGAGSSSPAMMKKNHGQANANGGLDWLENSVVVLRASLERFVREHGFKVAVWGASMHSLTALSVTGVRGIRFVVDSAAVKQGRFTPVSRLPIVSPETLLKESVNGVIVMAPRYSGEILEQLRRRFAFQGTVAVLEGDRLRVIREKGNSGQTGQSPSGTFLLELYRRMYLIRYIDERIKTEYASRRIRGPVHLSIGQEAVAVGTLAACLPADGCVGTHRDHAPYLAKGGDPRALIDELYGLPSGCAKGMGGSMHLYDGRVGFWGASAVVGGSIPVAAGIALAFKKDGKGSIAVGFTGDGATDEGVFFETLNLAALLRLPLLLVVENNGLSTLTPLAKRQSVTDIASKARALGVRAARLDGNNVMEIYEHAQEAVNFVRHNSEPYLIEAVTNRLCAHVGPVVFTSGHIGADEELSIKLKQEPLRKFRENFPELSDACERVQEQIRSEVDRWFEGAKKKFDKLNKKKRLPPPPPPQPHRV